MLNLPLQVGRVVNTTPGGIGTLQQSYDAGGPGTAGVIQLSDTKDRISLQIDSTSTTLRDGTPCFEVIGNYGESGTTTWLSVSNDSASDLVSIQVQSRTGTQELLFDPDGFGDPTLIRTGDATSGPNSSGIAISTGAGDVSGRGGNISVTCGAAGAGGSNGGQVSLTGGAGGAATDPVTTAGSGGQVLLTGGTGGAGTALLIAGNGGTVALVGGAPGASGGAGTGVGGNVAFTPGTGGSIVGTTTSITTTQSPSLLTVSTNPSSTNTTVDVLNVQRNSSGTPAASMGVAQIWTLENAANADKIAIRTSAVWVTATGASEDANYVVSSIVAGSLATTASFGPSVIINAQGAAGTISLQTAGTSKWQISNAGNLLAVTDATYSIGATGANRPLNLDVSNNIVAGNVITAGTSLRVATTSLTIATTTNTVTYTMASNRVTHVFAGSSTLSSGAHNFFTVTAVNNTGQTASTEISSVVFTTPTRTWAAGAITNQREFTINAPTYAFASASTITNAATFYVAGAPTAGSNATITTGFAAWFGAKIRIDAGVALGGGAAPTVGTIGGSGPATAAQNEWIEIHTNNGKRFVPAWA